MTYDRKRAEHLVAELLCDNYGKTGTQLAKIVLDGLACESLDFDAGMLAWSKMNRNEQLTALLEMCTRKATRDLESDIASRSPPAEGAILAPLPPWFGEDTPEKRAVLDQYVNGRITIEETMRLVDKMNAPNPHVWVPSTLGHGDTMCAKCHGTNRELAVLGQLDECSGGA